MPAHLRALPYAIHTNRELGLMLRGVKPLAKFVGGEGFFPDVVLRCFRMFDRHVASGRFVRRDQMVEHPTLGRLHYVYFALRNDEWRIQAMIDLISRPGKWSLDREREEGELLGYTSEQNDFWIELCRRTNGR